jgi:hypothetical protein
MTAIAKTAALALLTAATGFFAGSANAADLTVHGSRLRTVEHHRHWHGNIYLGGLRYYGPAYGYAPGYNGYEYVPTYQFGFAPPYYAESWPGYRRW